MNKIKFLELNFIKYDIVGKDDRKNLKIEQYELESYDENVIENLNIAINEYQGCIETYIKVLENKDYYEETCLDLSLNPDISFESWIYTLYLHKLKRMLLEIELLETLGYNIYSTSVARVIRDLKAKVKEEIEEVKLYAYGI